MNIQAIDVNIIEKAKKIKLLALDMDGVMTDGRVVLSDSGEIERNFSIYDGQGILWLQKTGVQVAVITACNSDVVPLRMNMLGVEHIYKGSSDKQLGYDDLLNKLDLQEEQVAYVGDDLPDLPVIIRSGLGITVPAAISEIKEVADFCTERQGGHGAVREVCELIMRAQGTFADIMAKYQIRPRHV